MSHAHPESISPTAHYTGYVWFVNGQSHEAFATTTGRVMYNVLRGPNAIALRASLPTLEGMLLARHQLIDMRLARAIEAGEINQIIEVAAGLSPRGWRFRTRYGDKITYVEADLPGMIAHKRRILAELGGETPHHRTVEIDALVDSGPTSIDAIAGTLDQKRGTAIITEGLINYFDTATMLAMWRRFAGALRRFPRNLYLSDLILQQNEHSAFVNGFQWLLSAFVRGKVHMHFDNEEHAERELAGGGLPGKLLDPRAYDIPDLEKIGAGRVRIVEASAR